MYSVEGVKLAQSTGMDIILQDNFDLKINDMKYRVEVPEEGECPSPLLPPPHPSPLPPHPSPLPPPVKFPLDGEQSLSDIRNLIHKLYASLNVDGHQVRMMSPYLTAALMMSLLRHSYQRSSK